VAQWNEKGNERLLESGRYEGKILAWVLGRSTGVTGSLGGGQTRRGDGVGRNMPLRPLDKVGCLDRWGDGSLGAEHVYSVSFLRREREQKIFEF